MQITAASIANIILDGIITLLPVTQVQVSITRLIGYYHQSISGLTIATLQYNPPNESEKKADGVFHFHGGLSCNWYQHRSLCPV